MASKEYNWLLQHPEIEERYAGEYIAVVEDQIVAHGKDFKEVLQQAKKHGEAPLFHKVPAFDKDQVV